MANFPQSLQNVKGILKRNFAFHLAAFCFLTALPLSHGNVLPLINDSYKEFIGRVEMSIENIRAFSW